MLLSFEELNEVFPYQNEKEIEKFRKIHNVGMSIILIIALLTSVTLYIIIY